MIKTQNLTMHYGPVRALDRVSFEVKQGEIVGLLGPNGAGKSTTMKILTTYLHPTSGTATVGGMDVLENPLGVRKIIGYLPEVLPLYMDMEVRAYLNFVARSRGLGGAKLRERTDVVLEECGLKPMYRKIIRELSRDTASAPPWPRPSYTTRRSSSSTNPLPAWTRTRSSRSAS